MGENKYVTDKRNKNSIIRAITKKIGAVKNLNLAIIDALVCIALLCFFSIFSPSSSANQVKNDTKSYYEQVENRLQTVLSEIKGAGNVKVMINYSGTSEIVTAVTKNTSTDKTTDKGSSTNRVTESTTEVTEPVIIQQNGEDTPVIIKEILPDIVGVIVVAEGAKDMSVKINLISAIQTLLNVSADKVEIFTMK
jgi:stage III sporulation protein AG